MTSKTGSMPAHQKSHTLTILHTNDTHGHVVSASPRDEIDIGGVTFRAALIDEIRESTRRLPGHRTLLLDGGDVLENTSMSCIFKGEPDILAMNMMGYDAMTLGNHEFGFSLEDIERLRGLATFPMLSANLQYRKDGSWFGIPSIVRNLDGLTVGIVGITSRTIFYNAPQADLDRLNFLEPEAALDAELRRMEAAGRPDLVIFLSHLGVNEDREIVKKVRGYDILIGAHSHTSIPVPEVIEGVIMTQAGRYGEQLGRLDVEISDGKIVGHHGRLIPIGRPDVAKMARDFRDRLSVIVDVEIGHLSASLHSERRFEQPAPLPLFVLEVIRRHLGADIAFETAASVGQTLEKGSVCVQDLYRCMPYNNYLVAMELTGAEIEHLILYSLSQRGTPYFIQMAGISHTMVEGAPRDIRINGQALDRKRIYKVATDNYMASGGAEDGLLKHVVRKHYHPDLIRHLVRSEIERGVGVKPYDVVLAATKAVDDVFSKLPPVPFAFRAPIPPALAAGMGIPAAAE